MNKLYISSLLVVVFLAGCAQETGAPKSDAAAEAGAKAAQIRDQAVDATDAAAESAAAVAGEASRPDINALMADADPDSGKRLFMFCQACHTVAADGPNKVGPNLHGFIGQPAAQVSGFAYSDALSQSGITWDLAAIDQWIEGPAAMVPGTTMVFAGIKDAEQRANLIAYLQQVTAASD